MVCKSMTGFSAATLWTVCAYNSANKNSVACTVCEFLHAKKVNT